MSLKCDRWNITDTKESEV